MIRNIRHSNTVVSTVKLTLVSFLEFDLNLVQAVGSLALSQRSRVEREMDNMWKMRTEGLLMQGDSVTHPSSTIEGFKWQVPAHAGPCALPEEREFLFSLALYLSHLSGYC